MTKTEHDEWLARKRAETREALAGVDEALARVDFHLEQLKREAALKATQQQRRWWHALLLR